MKSEIMMKEMFEEERMSVFYDAEQMEQIRLGFEHHLTAEQVKLYALKFKASEGWDTYSSSQMKEIRMGLEHGLTKAEVLLFANIEDSPARMRYLRNAIENGEHKEKIKIVQFAIEQGLTQEAIMEIADASFFVDRIPESYLAVRDIKALFDKMEVGYLD